MFGEHQNGQDSSTPAPAEPGDGTFWGTYSPRFEAPISYTVSALVLASFVGLLAVILAVTNQPGRDKLPPTLGVVGADAAGEGQEARGDVNPLVVGDNTPTADDINRVIPNPTVTLPQVKEEMRKTFLDDPNSATPIPDEKAAAWSLLDESIRKKMDGGGQPKGSDTGSPEGKGGTGADSTRQRSLRWILRFKTTSGRDYLNQLSALGAEVMVPDLEDGKKPHLFKDLADPKPGTFATEKDLDRVSRLIQFTDFTKNSVKEVADALGLSFRPKLFLAFFPAEMEEKLSKLETAYQNRRSEDIEETAFEMVMRGGKYEIVVAGQKLKK